jgi:hypothetical protein
MGLVEAGRHGGVPARSSATWPSRRHREADSTTSKVMRAIALANRRETAHRFPVAESGYLER